MILLRQVLGGHHDHRDVAPLSAFAQLVEELETIHFRHHEIEYDDVGKRLGQAFQSDPAVLGFTHLPSSLFEGLHNTPADDVVVVHHQHAAAPGSHDSTQDHA